MICGHYYVSRGDAESGLRKDAGDPEFSRCGWRPEPKSCVNHLLRKVDDLQLEWIGSWEREEKSGTGRG